MPHQSLGDFHTLVQDGPLNDPTMAQFIPEATRQAAAWLERNYTYLFMEVKFDFVITKGDSIVELTATASQIKSIKWARITKSDGNFDYLQQVDANDLIDKPTQRPETFWLAGIDEMYLGEDPDAAYTMETVVALYTDWLSNNNNFTHWLLDHAQDLLLAQTVLQLAPYMREPEWIPLYTQRRDEGLRTSILQDQEMRQSERQPIRVGFP